MGVDLIMTGPKREQYHITPTNDLKEHEEAKTCWCNPREENYLGADVIVHNSLDRREEFENVPIQ